MLKQAAQEPHWVFHHSIKPLTVSMHLAISPQIAKRAPHAQKGPLQPPRTRWHCCLCPSSKGEGVNHTRGFVARTGWAAEPEISANTTPPWYPPHGQDFHMGKEGICRKEGYIDTSSPVHLAKGSSGQLMVLKWSTCSSVLLETLCHSPCEQQQSFPKQAVWKKMPGTLSA